MAKDNKGLTLVEIIVAMVLLAGVMAGLTNVFVSGSRYVLHSRSRLSSMELGKFFLDPLQNEVRQDTWNTGGLRTGPRAGTPVTLDGITYNANYTITDQSGLRKVKVTLDWTEPAPF